MLLYPLDFCTFGALSEIFLKVLFTYLVAFSGNGGIQKFNRCFVKALHDLHLNKELEIRLSSPYDKQTDDRYIDKSFLEKSYGRPYFTLKTIATAYKYDVIILGHINLALIGCIIKLLFPKKKIILVAHGIEVWRPLSYFGTKIIQKADKILSVSEFTKDMLVAMQHADESKIEIFHNTIDPNFSFPTLFQKPKHLLDRYGIKETDKVVLTVARLSSTEQYKGYDHVINAFGTIDNKSNIIYLIAGKYDEEERHRLNLMIKMHRVENNVFLTGYINDYELTGHYLLADVFVMPSKKEGFGIVFIEAMACGLQVIAGNRDGSVDALRHGELGFLVDPDSVSEIKDAIEFSLAHPLKEVEKTKLQVNVIKFFGYEVYKNRLSKILAAV